ncbi:hypothetical protein GCM10010967_32000 [Dyadobacter beijingensis]|uniref:Fibronectin type-III domain-containing protein n=1 Tax=Dyadobacter beijingensis TaxID=365489 RepID=A0ABQ2I3D9_9BACT|nr:fibronectin type III domain-containing protein [Dyadobacter beijingensis]GGM96068.1 hypothetical protein GCM10010967_32000 [Dyadobacter beijingensis]
MNNRILSPITSTLLCLTAMLAFSTTGHAQRAMLRATAVSYQQVDLSWDRLPGTAELYEIERKEDGPGQNFANIARNVPRGTFAYQDKTVQENRTYIYRVKAYCEKSCGGEFNEARVTTPFAPAATPGNLEVFYISGRGVAITWQGNNSDNARFILERSDNGGGFGTIATVPYARSLSYNDNNVSPGNRYCYRVKAVNAGGESGYSNEGCVNLAIPRPGAPANLSAKVISSGQVDLKWQDNADNEAGFDVERSDNGTQFSKIGETNANAADFTDSGVQPNRKYWYRVVARNGGGFSDYSNVVEAVTPDIAPNTPRAGSAVAVSYQQINLSWGDVSDNETGFEIESSTNGTQFSKIASTLSNIQNLEIKDLKQLTTYYFRVRAVNAIGPSGYSETMSATTPRAPVPDKPTGLTATPMSFDLIQLKWNALSANAETVVIERSQQPNAGFAKIGSQAAANIQFPDREILDIHDYYYRVKAVNSNGESPYSDVAKVPAGAIITGVEPVAPEGLVYTHNNRLHIALVRPASGKLHLYDARGVLVRSWPLSQQMQIDLNAWLPGIYVAVLDGEKILVKQKVFIR